MILDLHIDLHVDLLNTPWLRELPKALSSSLSHLVFFCKYS